jgi:hypothetical protein
MLLAPVLPKPSHVTRSAALATLIAVVSTVGGFYWWSTTAIRHWKPAPSSAKKEFKKPTHPVIAVLFMIMFLAQVWSYFFNARIHYWDVYTLLTVLVLMLQPPLDSTNPPVRRIAWAMGLVVLYAVGPFLYGLSRDIVFSPLAGGVWLSLSILDFLLLRYASSDLYAFAPSPTVNQ